MALTHLHRKQCPHAGEYRPRRTGRLFVTLTHTTARQSGVQEAARSQVSRRGRLPSLSADAVPELSKLKECAIAPPPLQALEMHPSPLHPANQRAHRHRGHRRRRRQQHAKLRLTWAATEARVEQSGVM